MLKRIFPGLFAVFVVQFIYTFRRHFILGVFLSVFLSQVIYISYRFFPTQAFPDKPSVSLEAFLLFMIVFFVILLMPIALLIIRRIFQSIEDIKNAQQRLDRLFEQKLSMTERALSREAKKKYDIFLSFPTLSVLTAQKKEYKKLYDVYLSLKANLEKKYGHAGMRIYLGGETKLRSFEAIEQSKMLVAIVPAEGFLSRVLVEIGYALAREIPCILFYHETEDIPHILKSSDAKNLVIRRYQNEASFIRSIEDMFPLLVNQAYQ